MASTEPLDRDRAMPLGGGAAVDLALSLPFGAIQLFCGIGVEAFRQFLDEHARPDSRRSALFLEPRTAAADEFVAGILESLAGAAQGSWPLWYGGADFSFYRATTLHREAARLAIARTALELKGVSEAWLRAAAALAYAGRAPRVPGCSKALELGQLAVAVNPAGLILVIPAPATDARQLAAFVQGVEWTARHAPVSVVVLCSDLAPFYPALNRLAYGARWVVSGDPAPRGNNRVDADLRIWLPPVVGRPHPLSPVEQRMATALARDRELAPLFAFNQTVRTVRGSEPRVDLIWREGRLVVELDGYADHAERTKFIADRHRDYELALSGYSVLRIANEEAVVDVDRSVEKIRDMVRLRRDELGMRGSQ